MLTVEEINSLSSRVNYNYTLNNERSYFIENGQNATLFQWLKSKGTSFDCYIRFLNETNTSDVKLLNDKIDFARTIFYAFLKPFQSQFFYWTLLLLIMYKFNTRRPIIKLILYHYTFRAIGDIIEQLGKLLPYYHSMGSNGKCISTLSYTEQHPLKWFLTRQINSFFWYTGEIIGDWYPLLRTKAVTSNKGALKILYTTCIIYNISKLTVPISQLFVSPTMLYVNGEYNWDYVNKYYNYYWCLQALIIFSTFVYELVIYLILKKEQFDKTNTEYGFLKKFRLISEFRIIISAVVAIIAFPFLFTVSAMKIYFFYSGTEKRAINVSVEDFRIVVTNVQYMIIFIDQILLLNSKFDGRNIMKSNGNSSYYYSSDGNKTSGDYHNYYTGILHSQDTNVEKIVFNHNIDNKDNNKINKLNNGNNNEIPFQMNDNYNNNKMNTNLDPLRYNKYNNRSSYPSFNRISYNPNHYPY
ncbi:hypothetical protein BCR36DRAFT_330509 [Piromyces finnis]|uniref:Uncharacterized protein n=1 Tax=Piromyces finnis TaxID=1754191 RepID=A0A1Y1V5G4_9FUNG|nr:hypothetical protein BCR36DRAFT_330509 [Piromyces finnis]|eukprot:ORX47665.1 hypothetical protein BCR36DRAFT_330509 [Piromyces finnis]